VNSVNIHGVEIPELAKVLAALGCPPEKSAEMAAQLDKRARQLAGHKDRSYDEALQHLLALMKQGQAAQQEGSRRSEFNSESRRAGEK
jgi:thioredoxin-like negative regulator of GroEL